MAETIEFQLAGGGSAYALAGESDHVSEFRVALTPAVQAIERVRAATAQQVGRGNVSHRVSFLVTYAPAASAEAAKLQVAEIAAELAPLTLTHELLELTFGDSVFQLADCAMEPAELWHLGVTVYGRFSFIGGSYAAA